MYPGMARAARDEGFDESAEGFETLAKAEKSHARRFQKALDTLDQAYPLRGCPVRAPKGLGAPALKAPRLPMSVLPGWRKIWTNGPPNEGRSPKLGHRTHLERPADPPVGLSSYSMFSCNWSTKPSTRPPERLISEAYSERSCERHADTLGAADDADTGAFVHRPVVTIKPPARSNTKMGWPAVFGAAGARFHSGAGIAAGNLTTHQFLQTSQRGGRGMSRWRQVWMRRMPRLNSDVRLRSRLRGRFSGGFFRPGWPC